MKGLFYGIGHKPNSSILGGQVELYEDGYVKVRWGRVWWQQWGTSS